MTLVKTIHILSVAALILLSTVKPNTAAAFEMTKQEAAFLPQSYCRYTTGSAETNARPDIYQNLVNRYGVGWSHMHHYCRSLIFSMRAIRTNATPQEKEQAREMAVNEIDYVIKNSPPDFPLLPMVAMKKADYLYLFNLRKEAIKFTAEIMENFPEWPEPPARLAFYLRQNGASQEATAVLEKARQNAKDPAALEAQITRFAAIK